MPPHRRRLAIDGSLTVQTTPSLSSSLVLDPSHSGLIPGIVVPTLTIFSTSTSIETSSASPSSSSDARAGSISTPAIIGVTLGVFLCLAAALVVFMSVSNRRRLHAGGTPSRKAGSRMRNKLAQMLIHAKPGAGPTDPNARLGPPPRDDSFLSPSLKSTRGSLVRTQSNSTALPAPSPFLIPRTPPADSPIPNPFTSTRSPSLSICSNYTIMASDYQPHIHTLDAEQQTSPSMRVASSMSEYACTFPVPGPTPRGSAEFGRTRGPAQGNDPEERRAMQELISALDNRAHAVDRASRVDPMSRLSMGEGLVSPGGRSIRGAETTTPGP